MWRNSHSSALWLLILTILTLFIVINCDKPSFRIVAPQFICKGKGDVQAQNQITIR